MPQVERPEAFRPPAEGRCGFAAEAPGLSSKRAAAAQCHSPGAAVRGRAGQCRGLPDRSRKCADRAEIPNLGDAVQQRQLLLDLPRRRPPATRCRRISALHRPDARRSALLRRADRQHAGGARPGLQRSTRDAERA